MGVVGVVGVERGLGLGKSTRLCTVNYKLPIRRKCVELYRRQSLDSRLEIGDLSSATVWASLFSPLMSLSLLLSFGSTGLLLHALFLWK